MKIQFVKPPLMSSVNKATIHLSGKLGFSSGATKKLGISERRFIKVGINKEEKNDANLYVMVLDAVDEETIIISKAGNYYYANTKLLFDDMGIDYRSIKVIYDIVEIEYEGREMYKFIRRDKDRKKK